MVKYKADNCLVAIEEEFRNGLYNIAKCKSIAVSIGGVDFVHQIVDENYDRWMRIQFSDGSAISILNDEG